MATDFDPSNIWELWLDNKRNPGPKELQLATVEDPRLVKLRDAGLEQTIRNWASTKTTSSTPVLMNKEGLYQQLCDPYEIRLLRIEPGSYGEPLVCSLHHCSIELDKSFAVLLDDLSKPILYTALSYAWGLTVFDAMITCNGFTKYITKSLEAALLRFRKEQDSVVMWTDQICINQDDFAEKARQIPLMHKIYRQAHNTVIWLGDSSLGSDAALQFAEDIVMRLILLMDDMKPEDFERVGLPAPTAVEWRHFFSLFSRPWFSRLWILQEVRLSQEPWIVCGTAATSFWKFALGCFRLEACGVGTWMYDTFGDGSNYEQKYGWANMHYLSRNTGDSRGKPRIGEEALVEILENTRYAQCSDSRDKVYGLLAFCHPDDRSQVRISYEAGYSVRELYLDVATHSLRHGNINRLLTAVDHETSDFPSWVPDWRRPRQTTSLGASTSANVIYKIFQGSQWGYYSFGERFWSVEKREFLLVEGHLSDILVQKSSVFSHPDLSFVDPAVRNQTLHQILKFTSDFHDNLQHQPLFPAILQVLVAGKNDTGRQPCPDTFAEILSLLLDATTGCSPSVSGQTYSDRQLRPKGKGRLELANLSSRVPSQTFKALRTAVRAAMTNRVVGITKTGRLGLFPRFSMLGDHVYLIKGGHVPFVLRATSESGKFRLIGESYVHGMVRGGSLEGGGLRVEQLTIV